MFLKKKWLAMLAVITTVLLLAACGGNESSGDIGPQNGPQDGNSDDILSLSEALEKYPIWIETRKEPSRDSGVRAVYIFDSGKVEKYDTTNTSGFVYTVEEIIDMSDDEIIQLASDNSEPENLGEYTLDITIDEYGKNTKSIKLETPKTKKAEEEAGYKESPEYEPITFYPEQVGQTIFETTFSGFKIDDRNGLFTRVDNSYTTFKLDSPDTDKENVTIEGK